MLVSGVGHLSDTFGDSKLRKIFQTSGQDGGIGKHGNHLLTQPLQNYN